MEDQSTMSFHKELVDATYFVTCPTRFKSSDVSFVKLAHLFLLLEAKILFDIPDRIGIMPDSY